MAEQGIEMVRYADDFVILCRSPEEADKALEMVPQRTAEAGLTLQPTKTTLWMHEWTVFDFLGYRFQAGERWPRNKRLDRLRTTVREKTKRISGRSLRAIITDLNSTLPGWFEYFKHCPAGRFIESTNGYGCAYAAFCEAVWVYMAEDEGRTIIAGRTTSSPSVGCLA
jgi:hypothetical protein